MQLSYYTCLKGSEILLMQITLGDVIGWMITIASAVGVVVTVNISVKNINLSKNDKRKTKQHHIQTDGGNFIGGDNNGTT